MIFKPTQIIPDNQSFSFGDNITIKWSNNGDVSASFNIIVEDNTNSVEVYNSGRVYSYSNTYTLSTSGFISGRTYKYKIIVYNSVNGSATSDYKIFKLYDKPSVDIQTDGTIRNQVLTINSEYSQQNGSGLKSYKYILYDENKNILEDSGYVYSSDMTYTFKYLLSDDTKYFIECVVISQNDLSSTSGLVEVIADYKPPSVYFNLETGTEVDRPYVKLSWTTVRIIGNTITYTPSFTDSMLNVLNDTVYFDEGFSLGNVFNIRMWISSFNENKELFKVIGSNGYIEVKFYNGKFHAFKNINGLVTHIASQDISYVDGDIVYVCLQQDKSNINIYSEVI